MFPTIKHMHLEEAGGMSEIQKNQRQESVRGRNLTVLSL